MKAVILKPIMWNTNGYVSPSGYPSVTGYSHDNGFGHEEWNNNDKRVWRGFKLFHTESPERLLDYSATGELGILTIASYQGNQYAISVATNVYNSDPGERKLIVQELNIYDAWKDIWQLDLVKQRFNNDKEEFFKVWDRDYEWVAWKCPLDQYYHFREPILLSPERISGKSRLTTRHSKYQMIFPDQAIEIASRELPSDHSIIKWLQSTDFDPDFISPQLRSFRSGKRRSISKNKRTLTNSPAQREFEYWVKGLRIAKPRHAILQANYVAYLNDEGFQYKENKEFVDVQYTRGEDIVFSEIKPTENLETRYAIRAAIGQLLEYQYKLDKEAKLEIVLGKRPKQDEIEFVLSLGMSLTYFDEKRGEFTCCIAPDSCG